MNPNVIILPIENAQFFGSDERVDNELSVMN